MKSGTGVKKAKKIAHKNAHKKMAHKKTGHKAIASQTYNVDIQYTEDINGNIFINIPPFVTVKVNDDVDFVLDPAADATDFSVSFKSTNPFADNGSGKIDKAHHKTGKCKGVKGNYSYNVAIVTNRKNTVTIDPVIIVDP